MEEVVFPITIETKSISDSDEIDSNVVLQMHGYKNSIGSIELRGLGLRRIEAC